jgi:hypothetical protein
VPVLGYLLIMIGLISLGYGVLSARSWLNALHARRAATLARRRVATTNRTKDADDSDLRRASQIASVAGPSALAASASPRDDEDDLPPSRTKPGYYGEPSPHQEPPRPGGLGRLGRGLGRSAARPSRSEPSDSDEPVSRPGSGRPGGRLWRNPFDRDVEVDEFALPKAVPLRSGNGGETSASVSQPSSSIPPSVPVAAVKPAEPVTNPAVPPKPPKVLSRGAQRIQQIKAEARQAISGRRPPSSVAPAAAPTVAATPSAPTPGAAPSPGLAATAAAPPPVGGDRQRQQQRDLLALGLLDFDPETAATRRDQEEVVRVKDGRAKDAPDGKGGNGGNGGGQTVKAFVARLARRR